MTQQLIGGKFSATYPDATTGALKPAVGYKLYTYLSGTTTNKTTWSDSGLTAANANPVVLDARGEASVFLGTVAYTMVLKSATGATIWTRDGVSSGNEYTDTLRSDLAASSGAGLVGWIRNAIGAVFRFLSTKLEQDSVEIFDFMTEAQIADIRAGTGLVTLTTAIQAAVNYVNGFPSNVRPRLNCPAGLYLTDTISKDSSVLFHGDGSGQTQFKHINGSANPLFKITGGTIGSPTPAAAYYGFIGISFRAGNLTTDLIYHDGQIDNNVKFNDLQMIGGTGTVANGISCRDYLNWNIDGIRFDQLAGYGLVARDAQYFSNSHLHLNDWTYDNGSGSIGLGIISIDMTNATAFKGVVNLTNARIEINSTLTSAKPSRSLFRAIQNTTFVDSNPSQINFSFDNVVVVAVAAAKDCKLLSANYRNLGISGNELHVYGLNELFNNDNGDGRALPALTTTAMRYRKFSNLSERFDGLLQSRNSYFEGLKVGTFSSDSNLTALGGIMSRGDFSYHSSPTNSSGTSQGLRPFAAKAVQSHNGFCTIAATNLAGTGTLNASSAVLQMSTALSSLTVPGVGVTVPGAGVAAADLLAVIISVDYTANTVTLNTAASTSVAGVTVAFGLAQIAYVDMTFAGSAIPTTGTYAVGDKWRNTAVSNASPVVDYVCTVAGTPGTWRPTSHIVRLSTTANRPTLTASDVGVRYLDTTLAVAGEPIVWTGTNWVDGTGAIV